MINPWVILGVVLAWLASVTGSFLYGQRVESDHIEAVKSREERTTTIATAAAASAVAKGISEMKVQNVKLIQPVERETFTNTIYAECRHSDQQLRDINTAITGRAAQPAGSGVVPAASAAK